MFDKIKDHILRHKTEYLIGVVAGITWYIMKGRIEPCSLCRGSFRSRALSRDLNIRPFAFFSNQNVNVITIKQELGRPPYLIHDITDDLWYGSQTKTAKALGVSHSTVTRHLQGKRSHILGHVLERVPR